MNPVQLGPFHFLIIATATPSFFLQLIVTGFRVRFDILDMTWTTNNKIKRLLEKDKIRSIIFFIDDFTRICDEVEIKYIVYSIGVSDSACYKDGAGV